MVATTSDTVAGREGGKTAGGHKKIHHRIVEHGRSKRARQFVLMMMVMMARRAAATQIAATMSTMTSTAAGGAIRWRVAIGICESRKEPIVKNYQYIFHFIYVLPLKNSAKGELTPKNSRNTSSGGRKTNGKPPIMSKSSKSCV